MIEYLTFDDVNLVPQYSEVLSRKDCDTSTRLTRRYSIKVPIIAAPMDTVCDYTMASTLMKLGAVGCVHRFMSIEEQSNIVRKLVVDAHALPDSNKIPICMAIGATGDYLERATELIKAGANVLCIDVAHGHHIHVKNALRDIRKIPNSDSVDIIAGNVATAAGALDLRMWGADAIRVGVGGGSVCETRLRTGIGIPQLSAILDISSTGANADTPLISDGGIRYTGDVAKAICAWADSVMVGSLLAGTQESPGDVFFQGSWPHETKFKVYRGSASKSIKMEKNGNAVNVEGATKIIEFKGSAVNIINDVLDGLRSSMSYLGARNIYEMKSKAEFVKVTQAGIIEAKPHLL